MSEENGAQEVSRLKFFKIKSIFKAVQNYRHMNEQMDGQTDVEDVITRCPPPPARVVTRVVRSCAVVRKMAFMFLVTTQLVENSVKGLAFPCSIHEKFQKIKVYL